DIVERHEREPEAEHADAEHGQLEYQFPMALHLISTGEDPLQQSVQYVPRVDRGGDEREAQRVAARAVPTLLETLVEPLLAFAVFVRRRHHDAHFTTGGVSNVWCGAGEGTVHSSPSASSHTWSVAFSPAPRAALITTHTKMSCARPK